ncbi:MAG: hypothetical protein OEQ39_22010 [Gammaproteobacteria bacterium]|nr:hypothetical protein [Gammaproteobacteria bacterium]
MAKMPTSNQISERITELEENWNRLQATLKDIFNRTDWTGRATINDLVNQLRYFVPRADALKIAARIEELNSLSHIEGDEQSPMSTLSLQNFISFISQELRLTSPGIALSYNGNIRAEWRKSRRQHFAVEFLPTGRVQFVVFAPDSTNPKSVDRFSGTSSAQILMSKVHSLGVGDWAFG